MVVEVAFQRFNNGIGRDPNADLGPLTMSSPPQTSVSTYPDSALPLVRYASSSNGSGDPRVIYPRTYPSLGLARPWVAAAVA